MNAFAEDESEEAGGRSDREPWVPGTKTKPKHRLLAAEGLADTQIVSFVMKHAIGRLTPSDIPPQGS